MTASEMNPELRLLIEARLDAIDRVLAGAQVPWSERRSIVGEVETQVYELVSRRSETPTRDDVLAVLESLDPAESFIPEEQRPRAATRKETTVPNATLQRLADHAREFANYAAIGLAFVAANGLFVTFAAASDGIIPWVITLIVLARWNLAIVNYLRSGLNASTRFRDLRHTIAAWILPKDSFQGA
jgi:hypothetical protein